MSLPYCREVCSSKSEVMQTEKIRAPSCIPVSPSKDSPGMPALAMAAAAWSWVEKIIVAGPPHLNTQGDKSHDEDRDEDI